VNLEPSKVNGEAGATPPARDRPGRLTFRHEDEAGRRDRQEGDAAAASMDGIRCAPAENLQAEFNDFPG
jgi:hypothetical protein